MHFGATIVNKKNYLNAFSPIIYQMLEYLRFPLSPERVIRVIDASSRSRAIVLVGIAEMPVANLVFIIILL